MSAWEKLQTYCGGIPDNRRVYFKDEADAAHAQDIAVDIIARQSATINALHTQLATAEESLKELLQTGNKTTNTSYGDIQRQLRIALEEKDTQRKENEILQGDVKNLREAVKHLCTIVHYFATGDWSL